MSAFETGCEQFNKDIPKCPSRNNGVHVLFGQEYNTGSPNSFTTPNEPKCVYVWCKVCGEERKYSA